jgi:magnesium-transporting ATPase (P-type)
VKDFLESPFFFFFFHLFTSPSFINLTISFIPGKKEKEKKRQYPVHRSSCIIFWVGIWGVVIIVIVIVIVVLVLGTLHKKKSTKSPFSIPIYLFLSYLHSCIWYPLLYKQSPFSIYTYISFISFRSASRRKQSHT